eukprot:gene20839-1132_t
MLPAERAIKDLGDVVRLTGAKEGKNRRIVALTAMVFKGEVAGVNVGEWLYGMGSERQHADNLEVMRGKGFHHLSEYLYAEGWDGDMKQLGADLFKKVGLEGEVPIFGVGGMHFVFSRCVPYCEMDVLADPVMPWRFETVIYPTFRKSLKLKLLRAEVGEEGEGRWVLGGDEGVIWQKREVNTVWAPAFLFVARQCGIVGVVEKEGKGVKGGWLTCPEVSKVELSELPKGKAAWVVARGFAGGLGWELLVEARWDRFRIGDKSRGRWDRKASTVVGLWVNKEAVGRLERSLWDWALETGAEVHREKTGRSQAAVRLSMEQLWEKGVHCGDMVRVVEVPEYWMVGAEGQAEEWQKHACLASDGGMGLDVETGEGLVPTAALTAVSSNAKKYVNVWEIEEGTPQRGEYVGLGAALVAEGRIRIVKSDSANALGVLVAGGRDEWKTALGPEQIWLKGCARRARSRVVVVKVSSHCLDPDLYEADKAAAGRATQMVGRGYMALEKVGLQIGNESSAVMPTRRLIAGYIKGREKERSPGSCIRYALQIDIDHIWHLAKNRSTPTGNNYTPPPDLLLGNCHGQNKADYRGKQDCREIDNQLPIEQLQRDDSVVLS